MSAACCDCKVIRQTVVAEDIRLLEVEWHDFMHLPHAGQFFMVRAWPAEEQPFLSRPISVHHYSKGQLSFLYQVKGLGTQKISALQSGDTVQLVGPAGNGFDTASYAGKKIAVVGGGIGTAPLRQLCAELSAIGCKPDLYCGFRDVPYGMWAFEPLCNKMAVATDSGVMGHHGFVTDLFDAADYDIVLTCGPEIMMKNVAKKCAAADTRCVVSMEKKMACGVGACLGCTCHTKDGPKSVCKNGPVFEAGEVF